MKKMLLAGGIFLQVLFCSGLSAQEQFNEDLVKHLLDSIEQSFEWKTGRVDLPGGFAAIDVPASLRYLNPEQAHFVLADLWGNPPELKSMGMLFPASISPLSDSAWAFNINFDEMGFVKDDDAGDIDYNDLLKSLKEEAKSASEERLKMGYERVDIVGWASTPYYDKDKKVLHWAKEIQFGDEPTENTLNYDVRFLGRKGVLSLNAIGRMGQLDLVKSTIPDVNSSIAFTDGNRYADFDSKIDNVAAWTIGGLVAGKVLAKAGFFVIILKFIKPILLVVGGGGAAVWRFITGRRRKEEEGNPGDVA